MFFIYSANMQLSSKKAARFTLFSIAALACLASFAQQPAPAAGALKTETTLPPANVLVATGIITSAATGKPLAAINVSIPDYSAALTDDNGRFTIKVPGYNTTLFING